MKPFDVYPLYDVNIVRGKGCNVWDSNGQEYLDLYGGHAVISIGHSHPHYIECITRQLNRLGFYSNSVVNKLQEELAERLGKASGYDDYSLFLIKRKRPQAGFVPKRAHPRARGLARLSRAHIARRGSD